MMTLFSKEKNLGSLLNLVHDQGLTWLYCRKTQKMTLAADQWEHLEEYQANAISEMARRIKVEIGFVPSL